MSTTGPRSRSRFLFAAGLLSALLGLALLLAGPAEVGAALFFPGLVLAIAIDSRRPRPAEQHHRHAYGAHSFFDGSGGDFGGGGGDGG